MIAIRLTGCLVVLAVMSLAQPAVAVPVFNIMTLGFDDLEHTRDDGYLNSEAREMNAAGEIIGHSDRYNGGNTGLGVSAWLYNGSTTINISLTGTEYTRNGGYKYSFAADVNESGQVIGFSERYNGGSAYMGNSVWLYDGVATVDIGLTSNEYTRNDGYKYSQTEQLIATGQVSGFSYRYSGSIRLGQTAWVYNGATTIEIGLDGIEHTSSSDVKDSRIGQMNAAGQIIGDSHRYNGGSTDLGRSAWLYNGTTTINIGFTGGDYTKSDGYKFSQVDRLNEAGKVTGYSYRYNDGGSVVSRSAWLYNGMTTIDIGLTDGEHTRENGLKFSETREMNEAGQVSGFSYRYNGGSTDLGRSAWLYDGAATIHVGLTNSEHTRDNGYKYSNAFHLNEAGQVVGYSYRYNGGSTDLGQSAWLFSGNTTIDIGLTGSEHTRNDGYRYSNPRRMNEAGLVMGSANRYNASNTDLGQSTWLYDGTNTHDIGLKGIEHTRSDGYKYSSALQMNETGQVSGESERFIAGSTSKGYSSWLYNGSTTIDIGLTDDEHTSDGGYRSSGSRRLNNSGQVIGISTRYSGNTRVGQDAWFYDPALDHTFTLQLSTFSEVYAFSEPYYLGDDGLVLGTYRLFDDSDNFLGWHAFSFTTADGLHDLGTLVDGGLSASGWEYLSDAIRANGPGQILGHGKLTAQSGGQMAYLLMPIETSLPGDYNGNGVVDAADYTVWRDGESPDDTLGGYDLWKINFGRTAGIGSSISQSPPAVPEPTAALLATVAIAGLALLRKRSLGPDSCTAFH